MNFIDRRSSDPTEESYVILPDWGCAVTVGEGEKHGSLFYAPIMAATGEPERTGHTGEIDWNTVDSPEDQAFLDQVNAIFGTHYTLDQFPGR